MKAAEEIKKKIEEIDKELCLLDDVLSSSDEISVHELYEQEAVLMAKRYTLISQYEQLIAY
jgi:hypothetical protein